MSRLPAGHVFGSVECPTANSIAKVHTATCFMCANTLSSGCCVSAHLAELVEQEYALALSPADGLHDPRAATAFELLHKHAVLTRNHKCKREEPIAHSLCLPALPSSADNGLGCSCAVPSYHFCHNTATAVGGGLAIAAFCSNSSAGSALPATAWHKALLLLRLLLWRGAADLSLKLPLCALQVLDQQVFACELIMVWEVINLLPFM